jgi:hypothetical protein
VCVCVCVVCMCIHRGTYECVSVCTGQGLCVDMKESRLAVKMKNRKSKVTTNIVCFNVYCKEQDCTEKNWARYVIYFGLK